MFYLVLLSIAFILALLFMHIHLGYIFIAYYYFS